MMQESRSSIAYPRHPSASTSYFQVLTKTTETLLSSSNSSNGLKSKRLRRMRLSKPSLAGLNGRSPTPSYQAWTYAALIQDFNIEIQEGDISLHPCAYLHNCVDSSVVKSSFYEEHIHKAPVFLKNDVEMLADFLRKYVRQGDKVQDPLQD